MNWIKKIINKFTNKEVEIQKDKEYTFENRDSKGFSEFTYRWWKNYVKFLTFTPERVEELQEIGARIREENRTKRERENKLNKILKR